jgi:D-amino-acid dehydrogenase
MKIAVLGAGITGVTTAQALAAAGHEVVVLDRQDAAAQETSFANGGQISAVHAAPWAAPYMPLQAFKWMFQADAPLLFKPLRWDPALWRWGLRFLANCTAARHSANLEKALSLAVYSRGRLQALRQRYGLTYDNTSGGIVYVYRDHASLAKGHDFAKRMADRGLPQSLLDRDALLAEEPALRDATDTLLGGVLSPEDETGDAQLFSQALARIAADDKVTFRFGTDIRALTSRDREITGIATGQGSIAADVYVVCLGSYTPRLLRPLGLTVPIYPAKGYSLTTPITNADAAPSRSITDESRFIVVTRLGNRLRAAGTAELAGWDLSLDEERLAPITADTRALFPNAADYGNIEPWCGLRPATPDSVPILGGTRYGNLFLNTGHGTLGWTMACGSAQAVADLISGRTPEIDLSGFALERFGS